MQPKASKTASLDAALARNDEANRQAAVRGGTAAIDSTFDSNFTPDFFGARRQGFLDYATPQLEDQYGKAQKELTYSLARSGNLDSSARGYAFGQLQQQHDTGLRQIGDQALTEENQARDAVSGARDNLIQTLTSTGDAAGAANSAALRAKALSAPAAYSPIGDMFSGVTSALATQAAMERAQALSGGLIKAPYNTGIFGVNPRSVMVR